MSGLRHRRGAPQQSTDETFSSKGLVSDGEDDRRSKDDLLLELQRMIAKIREGPKPGLSHTAKKWKDALQEDPYNLTLIFELGLAYAQDTQWEKCANVMMRGWKRVNEFEDREVRCDFLITLCQASMAQNKFKQALAVITDIEDPYDDETLRRVEALRCYVYCSNGDKPAGLKAFRKAIDGQDFNIASGFWGMCYAGLKKVGLCEVTKSAVEALATNESDKSRLALIEQITSLKDACMQEAQESSDWKKFWRQLCVSVAAVAFVVLLFLLYTFEQRNLESLKLKR